MTNEWPFKGDSPAVRARKVAWAYRAAAEQMQARLAELDPEHADKDAVADLDQRFRQWGERWPAPVRHYEMDEWVTAKEAADIAGIAPGTIGSLRVRGRIDARLVDGKTFLYRVRDVHELAGKVRGRRGNATDRVRVRGRFAPIDWDAIREQSPPIANGAGGAGDAA
jgi:hypothetical protein